MTSHKSCINKSVIVISYASVFSPVEKRWCMNSGLSLSVAVIAKNEADRIEKLLQSCDIAKEIVVVDSGSTDGTQALCEKAGARVIFNEWPGYVMQKQYAMEATTSEWILCLDADEAISEPLSVEICE